MRVQEYIDGITCGKIVACEYAKLAVKRHVKNLKRQNTKGFPYHFDQETGGKIIKFFSYLKHWKGDMAGKPVELEPWEQFYLWDLFGWKRKDGSRKYRTSSLWVARKNGKTTLASGIGLYGLTKDGEQGPQIYSVATKSEQANICFETAVEISKISPAMKSRTKPYTYSLTCPNTAGSFKYMGADSKTMDGFDPYYCLADEVHAHKDAGVLNVMKSGMGARTQPLMLEISTAGFNDQGIGKEHWDYTADVLSGEVVNEAWHGIIFTLDEEEEWTNPKMWIKANPNLGVSKKLDYMIDEFNEAKRIPSKENNFKTKDLNWWTSSTEGFIAEKEWDKCNIATLHKPGDLNKILQQYKGRRCFGGLDLGSVSDFTDLALIFEPIEDDGIWDVFLFSIIPEDTIKERKNGDKVQQWVDKGWVKTTHGNVTDHNVTRELIKEIAENVEIVELAFDRYKMTEMVSALMDEGIEMTPFGQGYLSMSPAIEELERMALTQKLNHGGNPVLRWMMNNVVIHKDPTENRKFAKDKAQDKIDGAVALAMAIGRAVVQLKEEDNLISGDVIH